jgi:class 3 adenylate cyclase
VIDVRFARAADGTHVAYRVLDADPPSAATRDIVMVAGGLIPLEAFEAEPGFVRLLDGLRTIGRVVVFDRRGVGLSDPIEDWERTVVDQWTDDLAAVVDASESRDIVLVAWDGFGVGSRYAALHPERVSALVLYEPIIATDDGDTQAWSTRRVQRGAANARGEIDILADVAPSRATDRAFREWYTRAGRMGASPSTAPRIWESAARSLPRDGLLEQLAVPTLVLHRRDNRFVPPEMLTAARARIPQAVTVELEGRDHFPFVGDVDALIAEIGAFVLGEHRLPPPRRLLAAVLFTDLVGSTERAAALGDDGWKSVLDRHDAAVRAIVGRAGGSVVKTTGDGVLALLPAAGVGVQVARAIRRDLAHEGLEVRIGLHVGDVDRRGDDVSGLAVNIASRVMAKGGAGDIVVTQSVLAAVAGNALSFEPLGAHDLKGVPDTWPLYRVSTDA